jgi:hypothetical protein
MSQPGRTTVHPRRLSRVFECFINPSIRIQQASKTFEFDDFPIPRLGIRFNHFAADKFIRFISINPFELKENNIIRQIDFTNI